MNQIKQAAVLGAGVMGATIAAHLANSGLKVLLLDMVPREISETEKAEGLTLESPAVRNRFARTGLQGAIKSRGFYHKDGPSQVATGNFDDDIARLQECDWVVEVIVENMEIKKRLFTEKVVPNLKPGAILTTNTSGLSVNELAEGLPQEVQKNFLVTHFFNPPRYMRLLELVPSKYTDSKVLEDMAHFCRLRLGKGIVFGKDTPNFIANRIGVFTMCNALHHMKDMGLSIEEIDMVSGPATARPSSAVCKLFDLVGIDTLRLVADNTYRQVEGDEDRETFKLPDFVISMVEKGLTGRKAKQGFYRREKDGTILCYDYLSGEYRAVLKPKFASVNASKKVSSPAKKLKAVMQETDSAAEFAWRNLRDTLLYTVKRIPEIADDVVNVDNALKWGFSWSLGPFEMLDALGVAEFVKRVEADGLEVPEALKNVETFYKFEGSTLSVWDLPSGKYSEIADEKGTINLHSLRRSGSVVEGNDDASIHDLGDGVLGLEFHSKMNSLGRPTLEIINKVITRAEQEGVGLVIGNHGPAFSVGANLSNFAASIEAKQFEDIAETVQAFQTAFMAMKYSSIPVVAAPFNMTLGGGCEVALHADAINAHAETNMGLVEIGVGLIPAAGGTKEMAVRAMQMATAGNDVSATMKRNFNNIFQAKVSSSAAELYDMGMMRKADTITMDIGSLIADAKQKVIELAAGYSQPQPQTSLKAPGSGVAETLKSEIQEMVARGLATEYESFIGGHIAEIMAGGNVLAGAEISEQSLLDLEREVFLQLCGQPKTLERIKHMLRAGKVLRN